MSDKETVFTFEDVRTAAYECLVGAFNGTDEIKAEVTQAAVSIVLTPAQFWELVDLFFLDVVWWLVISGIAAIFIFDIYLLTRGLGLIVPR